MTEAQLQRQVDIVRQCLRAALLRDDPWAARSYRRRLLTAEEALNALRQARLALKAEQDAFEKTSIPREDSELSYRPEGNHDRTGLALTVPKWLGS